MIIELDDYSVVEALQEPFTYSRRNVVIIPTNQKGIFGAGIAKIIRVGMPEVEDMVQEAVKVGTKLTPNRLQTVLTNNPLISLALVPTKVDPYDKNASLTSIAQGLNTAFSSADYGDTFIVPRVGCGHGGLMWADEVRGIVEALAKEWSVSVVVPLKSVNIDDVKQQLARREAYDFCVHGYSTGVSRTPEYYALTFSGMEQVFEHNPDKFGEGDDDYSPWGMLDKLGFIDRGNDTIGRMKDTFLDLFRERRNNFENSEYFWREAFTDHVPRKGEALADLLD